MTSTLSVTPRTVPTPSGPGISKARGTMFSGTIQSDDIYGAVIAIGKSTGAPATYGGITAVQHPALTECDSVSIHAGGTLGIVATWSLNQVTPGGWSVGDEIWVALFLGVGSGAPGGSDVPAATAGPFTVVT